jgi:hypothetical protein
MLFTKAYPGQTFVGNERITIPAYFRGLNNAQLQRDLKYQNLKDLRSLMNEAERRTKINDSVKPTWGQTNPP